MKVIDEELVDIVESINFEGNKWASLVQIVEEDSIREEIRWSRGSKELSG